MLYDRRCMRNAVITGLVALASACFTDQPGAEPDDCDAGQIGCACEAGNLCLGGLECVDNICLVPGGATSTAASDGSAMDTGDATDGDGTGADETSASETVGDTSSAETTGAPAGGIRIWISTATEPGSFTDIMTVSAPDIANGVCAAEMTTIPGCAQSAAVFSLGGANVAALADTVPPGEVLSPTGASVADSFAAMLTAPLTDSLTGAGVEGEVYWTGTNAMGQEAAANCGGWTTLMNNGTVGDPGATDTTWLQAGKPQPCATPRPFLCVCWDDA